MEPILILVPPEAQGHELHHPLARGLWYPIRVTHHPGLPRTLLNLALEVPFPGKPLSPGRRAKSIGHSKFQPPARGGGSFGAESNSLNKWVTLSRLQPTLRVAGGCPGPGKGIWVGVNSASTQPSNTPSQIQPPPSSWCDSPKMQVWCLFCATIWATSLCAPAPTGQSLKVCKWNSGFPRSSTRPTSHAQPCCMLSPSPTFLWSRSGLFVILCTYRTKSCPRALPAPPLCL